MKAKDTLKIPETLLILFCFRLHLDHYRYLNGEFLLALILLVLAFAACYLMFDELALPGGVVFSMGLLWILATVLGARAGQIGLPPLVGMLLAGFLMKNVGLFGGDLTTTVTIKLLKDIALVIIMLRAGFGLDLGKLAANGKFKASVQCL
jgi:hypothetical protein